MFCMIVFYRGEAVRGLMGHAVFVLLSLFQWQLLP